METRHFELLNKLLLLLLFIVKKVSHLCVNPLYRRVWYWSRQCACANDTPLFPCFESCLTRVCRDMTFHTREPCSEERCMNQLCLDVRSVIEEEVLKNRRTYYQVLHAAIKAVAMLWFGF